MTGQARVGRTIEESEERWPDGPASAHDGRPTSSWSSSTTWASRSWGASAVASARPTSTGSLRTGCGSRLHTTAVCSPTRASLLTGRNCHSVGFGHVTERLAGFPGYSMQLPSSAATIAEILVRNGYSTRAVGKWHLTPSFETGAQGPFDRWPLGKGFQRFYGFLGGSTDQYAPELFRDNTPVELPQRDRDDYTDR